MRKIAVVTGTRAEYGYLKPLMDEIKKDSKLTLVPVITGMHLLPKFGNTKKVVVNDFPDAFEVSMKLSGGTKKDMAEYLSSGISNFTKFFSFNRPDILVVLGDRTEPLAAAIAALYLNIPIAHINGGDVSGTTIDESIRHAITKISHIHLVHTNKNAKRVERLGEGKNRIFVVGALTLDTILKESLPSKKEVFKKYNLNPDCTTILAIQHPITTLNDNGYSQLKELLSALDTLKEQTILLYPNCDAGGQDFINLIKKYENKKYLKTFENISHKDYLSIMKYSNLMVGNSSSGIIESPSFCIPAINIGTRQQGRDRSQNIIDVQPKKQKILDAINYALYDKSYKSKLKNCKNRFGDGKASQKIVKILKEIELDEKLIQKQITY